ncbi:uncharacterized protein LOC125495583 [Beta vulgaris subsp. vulgaris]|uniref:uncharacterized protein LOC125495583 n=1 Tax=Beta vulgaris subsp. vulgaris TaxID=3555 RepID=UPI0020376212|nr:uncharacterized protein LOC125495583 [Beta vulgaris subsp. vulgaris]
MSSFRMCVAKCGVVDLPSMGCYFTWNNKQQGEGRVFSKIDRVMGNARWMDRFSAMEVVFLLEGLFDHSPVIMRSHDEIKGNAPFKYFIIWCQAPDLMHRVRSGWQTNVQGSAMLQLVKKLKNLKAELKCSSRVGVSNLQIADSLALKMLEQC